MNKDKFIPPKVYLLSHDDADEPHLMLDKDFIKLAKSKQQVYGLEEFEDYFNSGLISDEDYIRIR